MHRYRSSATIAAGDAKLSVTLDLEEQIDADFRFVKEEQFASAIHHFTGSKDHNIRMRQLAKSKGMKISEYGVEDEEGYCYDIRVGRTIFRSLRFAFHSAAFRRNGSEIDRVDELAGLIAMEDIRSDLHMHTTWSDGGYSIREMVEACRAKGYSHMVITDHTAIFESGEWLNARTRA